MPDPARTVEGLAITVVRDWSMSAGTPIMWSRLVEPCICHWLRSRVVSLRSP